MRGPLFVLLMTDLLRFRWILVGLISSQSDQVYIAFFFNNSLLSMTITLKNIADSDVTCSNCQACCCRMEVMIISDTGTR